MLTQCSITSGLEESSLHIGLIWCLHTFKIIKFKHEKKGYVWLSLEIKCVLNSPTKKTVSHPIQIHPSSLQYNAMFRGLDSSTVKASYHQISSAL